MKLPTLRAVHFLSGFFESANPPESSISGPVTPNVLRKFSLKCVCPREGRLIAHPRLVRNGKRFNSAWLAQRLLVSTLWPNQTTGDFMRAKAGFARYRLGTQSLLGQQEDRVVASQTRQRHIGFLRDQHTALPP